MKTFPGYFFAGAVLAGCVLGASPISAQTTDLVNRSSLRVCADPANLPMSNEKRQGFENRIADLIGKTFGIPVTYTWFPQATGFVRQTLNIKKCDLIIGFAQGHELVQNTNHYYRSIYVMFHKAGNGLDKVESLDDPLLKDKRIAVVAGTPPATILALNGLIGHAVPFPLTVDRRYESPAENMIKQVESGEIPMGILWGPIGGPLIKQMAPDMVVKPLNKETKGPRMSYRITMGLRPNEPDWKHQLNDFIKQHQEEINTILLDAGVPIVDEKDQLIGKMTLDIKHMTGGQRVLRQVLVIASLILMGGTGQAEQVPEPGDYRMDHFRAPVPDTLKGARVVNAEEAYKIWEAGQTVFIDVLPQAPKPEKLPDNVIWRDNTHDTIRGGVWLPNVGFGKLHPDMHKWFASELQRLTGGDKTRPVLFYCLIDCWMSWNAGKRALEYGYTNVAWFPDGMDGWNLQDYPVETISPLFPVK